MVLPVLAGMLVSGWGSSHLSLLHFPFGCFASFESRRVKIAPGTAILDHGACERDGTGRKWLISSYICLFAILA